MIKKAFLSPSYSSVFFLLSPKNKMVGNPSILFSWANFFCSSQFTAPILNIPFVTLANLSNSGWKALQ